MLSQEELEAMVAEEEKRLGVGSREFMERHNEIMTMIEQIRNNMKNAPVSTANTDKS